MPNTILVAVDFEEASKRAIDLAKELAPALDATLCLVHVYRLPVYTYPGFEPQILPDFRHEVTRAARKALEDLAESADIPHALLREGDAAHEILAAAREVHASLIAMGTHARRGLAHALLGSVAEDVVRRSEIPVLTVRADGTRGEGKA